ncbi:MAG: dTDP-4-amino-4,6-dideoxygalactose transaminase [Candidatus Thiodiazotropha sp.]
MKIPFNKPYTTGNELAYIEQALYSRQLAGGGPFTKKCVAWLERSADCHKALLTHSCTAALEMAALLADIQPGDEIIMPSYTFVSTANAFVLRGGVPVFVDIREDTLNIDETKIESAITDRTKAIVPVHYAGVGCEMDTIMTLAAKYGLLVIEDAAQGVMAAYKGRPLGSIGHLAAFSFHETKNIVSGEGGALLVNDPRFADRAEYLLEKGTNRSQFFRGEVNKYLWVDLGSSFLASEITAACLYAQLEAEEAITQQRLEVWNHYHSTLEPLEKSGILRRPIIPPECQHNAHMYYLLLPDPEKRSRFIDDLNKRGIATVFHYIPLDSAPMGQKVSRGVDSLAKTHDLSDRLVRLPLWVGVEDHLATIIDAIERWAIS